MLKREDVNITLDYDETLDEFLSYLKPLGVGGEGSCYVFRGRALKVFDGPKYSSLSCNSDEGLLYFSPDFYDYDIDETLIPDEEYIMRYSSIQNDTFVFADGIFRTNNKIRGLFMPLITMPRLREFRVASTKYDSLIRALKKCTKDVKLISSYGIEIVDVADVNIFFDGRNFKIADTLEYKDNDAEPDIVLKTNVTTVSKFLIEYFTKGNIKRSLKLNKNMLDLYRDRKNIECPSMFFTELKRHLGDVCDTPINSISSAEKILAKKYAGKI